MSSKPLFIRVRVTQRKSHGVEEKEEELEIEDLKLQASHWGNAIRSFG
jgi:hypothetical protein